MATTEIPFLLGAAFKNQTVRGTATTMPAIGGGSGTGGAIENVSDGAVLGDAGSGVGETGIAFAFGKKLTEKAVLTGSYTRDFANFVARTVDAFTVTIPLKGNGETTTVPVGGDFTPDLGIVALLRGAGLVGGVSGALWRYVPTSTLLATAALYYGNASGGNGGRIIVKDVEAATAVFAFTPGEVATLEFALGGVYESHDETGTWPSSPFEYGNQASLSAPAVTAVAFQWGPSVATPRAIGFSDLSVTLDNLSNDIPSSNADSGSIARQTGRNVSITATLDAAAAEILYEMDQLGVNDIANADPLSFLVGTAAGAAATANAYALTFDEPELISLEAADPLGNSQAWTAEWTARSTTANGEFKFDYL